MTLTYKIASWCGLIRVIVNWIVAEVVLVCLARQSHKVILWQPFYVVVAHPGNAWDCPGLQPPMHKYHKNKNNIKNVRRYRDSRSEKKHRNKVGMIV